MSSKRVACYARVSTMDQATGLESQIRVLKTYCEQNNIENVEFFTDEGISGTKSNRPALDRMMAQGHRDGGRFGAGDAVRGAEAWRPWRAVAARILWHGYLSGGASRPAVSPGGRRPPATGVGRTSHVCEGVTHDL